MAFLVAIMSAIRVLELATLGFEEPFVMFFLDRLVSRPMPGFVPKLSSSFYITQEIIFLTFLSGSTQEVSLLYVTQALKSYIETMAHTCSSFRVEHVKT